MPIQVLHEESTNHGSKNCSDGPCPKYDGEILWSLTKRNDVREDYLTHGDDPSSSDPLYTPPSEKEDEVVRESTKCGSEREEDKRYEEELLSAKEVGE